MRLIGSILAIGLVLLVKPVPALAEDDGNDLLRKCVAAEKAADGANQGEREAVDAIDCMSYLQGILDMNMLYQAALNKPKPQTFFCLPTNIKNGQAARIVVKYLRAHPEQLHRSGAILAVTAFAEAFPCPN